MSLSNNQSRNNNSLLSNNIMLIAILFLFLVMFGIIVYLFIELKSANNNPPQPQIAQTPTNYQAPPDNLAASYNNPNLYEQTAPIGVGMALGKYKGEPHPIVDLLAELKGFKQDKSIPDVDTVFIIYDPRCPYCHTLFDMLKDKDLAKKDITVKWLPALALGQSEDAVKMAQLAMDAKTVEDFGKSLDAKDLSSVTPTEDTREALNQNLAFLFEASNQTFGSSYPKAVPAVFFINKEDGSPNMMYGASEPAIFNQIFGDL